MLFLMFEYYFTRLLVGLSHHNTRMKFGTIFHCTALEKLNPVISCHSSCLFLPLTPHTLCTVNEKVKYDVGFKTA